MARGCFGEHCLIVQSCFLIGRARVQSCSPIGRTRWLRRTTSEINISGQWTLGAALKTIIYANIIITVTTIIIWRGKGKIFERWWLSWSLIWISPKSDLNLAQCHLSKQYFEFTFIAHEWHRYKIQHLVHNDNSSWKCSTCLNRGLEFNKLTTTYLED